MSCRFQHVLRKRCNLYSEAGIPDVTAFPTSVPASVRTKPVISHTSSPALSSALLHFFLFAASSSAAAASAVQHPTGYGGIIVDLTVEEGALTALFLQIDAGYENFLSLDDYGPALAYSDQDTYIANVHLGESFVGDAQGSIQEMGYFVR